MNQGRVFRSLICLFECLQSLESDGSLTFELPLPNPERQESISRFVDGLRAAIATPVSMSQPAPKAIGEDVLRSFKILASTLILLPALKFSNLEQQLVPCWSYQVTFLMLLRHTHMVWLRASSLHTVHERQRQTVA